jgi:M6 family metalloprotease-like protein
MRNINGINLVSLSLIVVVLIGAHQALNAMPPHPDLKTQIQLGKLSLPDYLISPRYLQETGINQPSLHPISRTYPTGTGPVGSFNALVLLVDFSDNASTANASFFDTLVFENQQGCVRHYYREISYDALDIVTVDLPSTTGWQTAPQTYSYYVNGDYGLGSYPQNAQKLVEDLVDLVDPIVDFSQYDNDSDGEVDALIVVHAGPGAEYTGSLNDIWSHKWGVTYTWSLDLKDGVQISEYAMQPEYWLSAYDMTCGVYCHELGHIFGLPDFYDTDYSSNGIGKWSLMAGGSWNGSLGNSPAHPDGWCMTRLGYITPTTITADTPGVPIPAVKNSPTVYKLWTDGSPANEYFLVENRQKIGYDTYLPHHGLLIYHVDDNIGDYGANDLEWYPGYTDSGHYKVALEQADGLWEMEQNLSSGNSGDPYPGNSVNRTFNGSSLPNSQSYAGTDTDVGVMNISDSGDTMTCDFFVSTQNDTPVVSDIPNQTVAEGQSFASISLDDYVNDPDDHDSLMIWTHWGETELLVDITSRVATISVPNPEWNGAETVWFKACDPGALCDSNEATFTVTAENDTPVVADIPNQTIAEGESFTSINLDDYVTDPDDHDSVMVWTHSGETELLVDITDRVATISVPSPDWNGAETIWFKACDPAALCDSNEATFTVTAANDTPVVSDIPNQTIAEGQSFASISLDDYVTDVDDHDSVMIWAHWGETDLLVDITDRVATISVPNPDWNGSETIWFKACDPGALCDSNEATFTVTAVNDTPAVSDIPNQTITEGESFTSINLDDYVTDPDDHDSVMIWTHWGETELLVDITDRVATISVPSPEWNGAETIWFRACDLGALCDSNEATFTVAANDTPVVSDIPDQTIAEGQSFASISLDDYVADPNDHDSVMIWTHWGETDLLVDITDRVATISVPNPDWNGSETIWFKACDPGALCDSNEATFTVTAVNDTPAVSDIPNQTIAEGESFASISLDDYVTDPDDHDSVMIWTHWGETDLLIDITDRVATISVPNPEWNGAETVWFKACDPGALCDSNEATFTVTAENDTPVVADIPNQTIAEGQSFASISLDDYVTDPDDHDSVMIWTHWGETDLLVDITDRVATITVPNPDWNGSETIWFKACDPGGLCDSNEASFTITAENDTPLVSDILNQSTPKGQSFTPISLDDYVTDPDDHDSVMIWTHWGEVELLVDITDRVATISAPNPEWSGAETIWFKACDPGGLCDSNEATFTVSASDVDEHADDGLLPHSCLLTQNYPNPFNPQTKIEFNLKKDGWVKLEVFDILGHNVVTLVDGYKKLGQHVVTWNGTDEEGKPLSSGIYLYRISFDNFQKVNKMILLK